MEYWLGVLDEAFPIRYVLGLVMCVGILYFGGDRVHEYYVGAADVVEEIVNPSEVKVETEIYVSDTSAKVVYKIGHDTVRAMLI